MTCRRFYRHFDLQQVGSPVTLEFVVEVGVTYHEWTPSIEARLGQVAVPAGCEKPGHLC